MKITHSVVDNSIIGTKIVAECVVCGKVNCVDRDIPVHRFIDALNLLGWRGKFCPDCVRTFTLVAYTAAKRRSKPDTVASAVLNIKKRNTQPYGPRGGKPSKRLYRGCK